jgi:transposase
MVTRSGSCVVSAAWQQIAPLPPKNGGKGKEWHDNGQVIDGILWRQRTGDPSSSRHQPHRTEGEHRDGP